MNFELWPIQENSVSWFESQHLNVNSSSLFIFNLFIWIRFYNPTDFTISSILKNTIILFTMDFFRNF